MTTVDEVESLYIGARKSKLAPGVQDMRHKIFRAKHPRAAARKLADEIGAERFEIIMQCRPDELPERNSSRAEEDAVDMSRVLTLFEREGWI